MQDRYDAVIVGGGFYGLRIAQHLRERLGAKSVAVLEAADAPMERASFVNQARVHNGYHYPRSILTGIRSRLNLPRFRQEYASAVIGGFDHYYAIASRLSKTNARQFELYCRRIGAAIDPVPLETRAAFDPNRIERVFRVEEPAFDARVLRELMLDRLQSLGGIEVITRTRVERVGGSAGDLEVVAGRRTFRAPQVVGAAYSGLNELHAASGLPLLGLQHELTELAVISMPDAMRGAAITVMDGPFFSIMPFPSRSAHTLTHVRYTPHRRWRDDGAHRLTTSPDLGFDGRSQYTAMRADVVRYLPAAAAMQYVDSLFEIKTVLTRSSNDDSRPILFRADHGVRGYACVLGGKLDNIYDVLEELERHAA